MMIDDLMLMNNIQKALITIDDNDVNGGRDGIMGDNDGQ
jgi:hypothetical protein